MKGISFQRAISPLTVFAAVFGYALIEYPVGKPRRLLSLVYAILPVGLIISMFCVRKFILVDDPVFRRSFTENILNFYFVIVIVTVCLTQWNGKCLDGINEVDETLMKLGCKDDSRRLRRAVVATLITWFCWNVGLTTFDATANERMKKHNEIGNPAPLILLNAHLRVTITVEMLFWFLLRYVGMRFDCINNSLRELAPDDNDSVGWFRLFRGSATIPVRKIIIPNERNKRIIWTMMHLHFRLMEVSRDINRALQMQVSILGIMSYAWIQFSMIYTLRIIYTSFEPNKLRTITIVWVWTLAFFVKIVTTNCLCATVSGKAASVSDTTVNLLHHMDDETMREDVPLIILQAKHKPLRFSSLGLNYFGYQNMHSMFASMVSMAVIILQLKVGLD